MAVEAELQFLYEGKAPPVVPAELAEFVLAGSERVEVVDTYYDTPDLRLRKAGCTLRVRQAGDHARPRLTWKGPARRRGSAKVRQEVELALDVLPKDARGLVEILVKAKLWGQVRKALKSGRNAGLAAIGALHNDRSIHTYIGGLHRLELTWDRLRYPVGPLETRLEVEAKSSVAMRYLDAARSDLGSLFGDDLVPPPRGKVRELCRRLYPDDIKG